MIISCKKTSHRIDKIKTTWLPHVSIPHVILQGNPSLTHPYHFDETSRILTLRCEDNYDELPHKVCCGLRAVNELFQPEFVVKVDDDVVIHYERFNAYLTQTHGEYEGNVNTASGFSSFGIASFEKEKNKTPVYILPTLYCTGPIYFLGKRSIYNLILYMDPENMKFEDVNVGATLFRCGIGGTNITLYTNSFNEFLSSSIPAWHDKHRESPQTKQ